MIGIKRNGCVWQVAISADSAPALRQSWVDIFPRMLENIETSSCPHVLQVKAGSEKEIFRFLAADFVL